MFAIIVYCIVVAIFILKPNSFNINLHNFNSEKFCDSFTGTWNGEDCICKHPDFITNNHYNGNCDKIVDVNCKRILDSEGKILDFKKQNPFTEGICDCGHEHFYDILTRKCVLRRLNSPRLIREIQRKYCDDGYYYNTNYKTCLKKLCSWDILNPLEKIDQVTLSQNVCSCDFQSGFVPISLEDGTVGCTRAVDEPRGRSRNHIILMEKNKETHKKDWNIFHLYPLTALTDKFKKRLDQNYVTGGDDSGADMVAIQQSHGNWMDDILSTGVTIACENDYKEYDKFLGYYDASTNELIIKNE